jgi:hypothetical protein
VESDSFQMKRVPDDDSAGTKEAALHLGAD